MPTITHRKQRLQQSPLPVRQIPSPHGRSNYYLIGRTRPSCHSALDRFGQEVEDCRAALDIFQQLGDAWSVAWGQCALARAWSDMGDHQKSLHIYQEALEAFREFGDKRNQLRAMVGISEALDAMGESEATAHWHRAALLADRLDEPQTAEMRGKIARALGAAGREGDSQ